jgi:hypothetical protein
VATTRARKVTVSLRADLVDLVDAYVDDHKKDNINRSAIVEEALLHWTCRLQEEADELYFVKNATQLNADAKNWLPVATESIRRNLR